MSHYLYDLGWDDAVEAIARKIHLEKEARLIQSNGMDVLNKLVEDIRTMKTMSRINERLS